MNAHPSDQDLLRYLSFEDEASDVEQHLDVCPECMLRAQSEAKIELGLRELASLSARCHACSGIVLDDRCEHCGAALRAGDFVIERMLTSNAHGRVYLAHGPKGEKVALKELVFVSAPSLETIESFQREAGFLGRLSHPSIPRYVGSFQIGEGVRTRLYLAQEYLGDQSLLEMLPTHTFTEHEVVEIGVQVLVVLEHLQSLSPMVVHRDIKPSNLIRCANGRIALIDFGAARDVSMTRATSMSGTFGYMPIEQLAGIVDKTTDVYALAMSLVHLLTRRDPWAFQQDRSLFKKLNVGAETRAWLEKATAQRREDRFASAGRAKLALIAKPKRTVPKPVMIAFATCATIGASVAMSRVIGTPPAPPVEAASTAPTAPVAVTPPEVAREWGERAERVGRRKSRRVVVSDESQAGSEPRVVGPAAMRSVEPPEPLEVVDPEVLKLRDKLISEYERLVRSEPNETISALAEARGQFLASASNSQWSAYTQGASIIRAHPCKAAVPLAIAGMLEAPRNLTHVMIPELRNALTFITGRDLGETSPRDLATIWWPENKRSLELKHTDKSSAELSVAVKALFSRHNRMRLGSDNEGELSTSSYDLERMEVGEGELDAKMVPALLEAASEPHQFVIGAHLLSRLRRAGRAPTLPSVAAGTAPARQRLAAIFACHLAGDDVRVDDVIRAYRDETSVDGRQIGLAALAWLSDARAKDLVLEALGDVNEHIRRSAASSSGQLKLARAIDPIARMMERAKGRGDALPYINALGQIGGHDACEALAKQLELRLATPTDDISISDLDSALRNAVGDSPRSEWYELGHVENARKLLEWYRAHH